jgi:serine/threonine protein kinase
MDLDVHNPLFIVTTNNSTSIIGQGAYGIVYKGKKEDTGDTVAIKRIPFADSTPEGGVPCNVIREISLLRELDHPNVVRAFCAAAFALLPCAFACVRGWICIAILICFFILVDRFSCRFSR